VWLLHQLRAFERYHPLPVPRRYVSGETHLYLGRQYRLRIRRGADGVKLSAGFLLVTTGEHRNAKRLVNAWYRQRARDVFERRLRVLLTAAPWLNRSDHSLRVRPMTRRWGSCGPSGVITLNVDLVKAPPSCIDYILAHELSHLLELNHSKRFYALLERAVPDWRLARERLNQVVR
jgi:predicted metal-dependent hydrolase